MGTVPDYLKTCLKRVTSFKIKEVLSRMSNFWCGSVFLKGSCGSLSSDVHSVGVFNGIGYR